MRIKHMLANIAFSAVALVFLPSASVAQTYLVQRMGATAAKGYDDVHISKAALAGQTIRVWWATLLNPDCSAAGTMTTQIVSTPHHGQANISDDPFFPNFMEPNPRAACDTHKVSGKQAFYTADAAFHGHDKVVIQNATSEGRMRRIIVDIAVQ